MISLMRTVVCSWRWPRLRREFLRRRFLKAMTLRARPCSTTSAVTLAPEMVGLPILRLGGAGDHQHLGELHRRTGVARDLLDRQHLVRRHAILLAASLDDSVHA